MSEVSIKVKDNGPLVISGPIRLEDGADGSFALDREVVALCRCGHSANKPFCDGSHNAESFASEVRSGGE